MFGRKDTDHVENETQDNATTQSPTPAARAVEAPHAAQQRSATPAVARRVVEMPSGSTRRTASNASSAEERKLTVGKGLSLAGEITSCDILVVEGKVEAKLSDGKLLEITESGQFRGNVEIENADIAGRYDGQLVVHGRLTVRSTGRVSGMIKYGELEVSAGGQIIGELQVGAAGAQPQSGNGGFKSAARHAAIGDADDASKTERKSA